MLLLVWVPAFFGTPATGHHGPWTDISPNLNQAPTKRSASIRRMPIGSSWGQPPTDCMLPPTGEPRGHAFMMIYDDFFIDSDVPSTWVVDVELNPANPQQGMAITASGSYYSPDGGNSWIRHPANDVGDSPGVGHSLAPIPDGSGVIASEVSVGVLGGTFWIYTWDDNSWQVGNANLQSINGQGCLGVDFDQSTPPVLYVGHTQRPAMWTDDLGQTLCVFGQGLPTAPNPIVTMADPVVPERVLENVGNTLYLSTSRASGCPGGDWVPLATFSSVVSALIHHPSKLNELYLGTVSDGVFKSTDSGVTWVAMTQAGLSFLTVADLGIHPLQENTLYATFTDGTVNGGTVHRYFISHGSGSRKKRPHMSSVDEAFSANGITLSTNYPNPFSANTRISFRLAESERVRVRIFNPSGRLVKTLVNGVLGEGDHYLSWDGTDDYGVPVSSGIYLYSLETTQGPILTRRLALLR